MFSLVNKLQWVAGPDLNRWSHFLDCCCVFDASCYVGSKFLSTPSIASRLISFSGTFQESDRFARWTSANRRYRESRWIYKAPAHFSSWFALPGFTLPSCWNYPVLYFSGRRVSFASQSFYCGVRHKEKSRQVQMANKSINHLYALSVLSYELR